MSPKEGIATKVSISERRGGRGNTLGLGFSRLVVALMSGTIMRLRTPIEVVARCILKVEIRVTSRIIIRGCLVNSFLKFFLVKNNFFNIKISCMI